MAAMKEDVAHALHRLSNWNQLLGRMLAEPEPGLAIWWFCLADTIEKMHAVVAGPRQNPPPLVGAKAFADRIVSELRPLSAAERTGVLAIVIMEYVAGDDPMFLLRLGTWLSDAAREAQESIDDDGKKH